MLLLLLRLYEMLLSTLTACSSNSSVFHRVICRACVTYARACNLETCDARRKTGHVM